MLHHINEVKTLNRRKNICKPVSLTNAEKNSSSLGNKEETSSVTDWLLVTFYPVCKNIGIELVPQNPALKSKHMKAQTNCTHVLYTEMNLSVQCANKSTCLCMGEHIQYVFFLSYIALGHLHFTTKDNQCVWDPQFRKPWRHFWSREQ